MVHREELDNYCNKFLCVKNFKDYGPNGLQIEGSDTIDKIISGVSANLDLIELAIEENADAIFVHHGIFWDNESNLITGAKRKKIALLMNNNINLFGYHLPLDDHPEVGNNIELGRILGIKKMRPVEDSYLWQGELKTDLKSFSSLIEKELGRTPQLFGEMKELLQQLKRMVLPLSQLDTMQLKDMEFSHYAIISVLNLNCNINLLMSITLSSYIIIWSLHGACKFI